MSGVQSNASGSVNTTEENERINEVSSRAEETVSNKPDDTQGTSIYQRRVWNSYNIGHYWIALLNQISSVKNCMKLHSIRRVIGNNDLTYDELNTVIIQSQACHNSRPSTPLSEDQYDLNVLTPGIFLIRHPLVALPQEDVEYESDKKVPSTQSNDTTFLVKIVLRIFISATRTRSMAFLNGEPAIRTEGGIEG
ncbi:hypothetical protein JTB14_008308 [Gonioctena quinquepunctata]|nr:hypothetical protein JTB14_008308 [Gonioctena quinquepunctata]